MGLDTTTSYTTITPIPGHIPRQLAIDLLHSHEEVIRLNPLVLTVKPIPPPSYALADEYYSTWYEITERVKVIPGMGKMGSSKITFAGVFHDLPWGLQSHIYANLGIDLRNKYRIAGNQPGFEPPEQQEMGLAALGAPKDGLYLREDIQIKCNPVLAKFVKGTLQKASKEMVARMIKKAELVDKGVLKAMIENGKIKTHNPADLSFTGGLANSPQPQFSPPHSPGSSYSGSGAPGTPTVPYQVPRPVSLQPPPSHHQYGRPSSAGSQPGSTGYYPDPHKPQNHFAAELPSHEIVNHAVVMELPGDMYHAQGSPRLQPPQPSPGYSPHPTSATSDQSRLSSQSGADWRWSQSQGGASVQSSRPTSVTSDIHSAGLQSPPLDHKGFSSNLPPHQETREEYRPQGGHGQPQGSHAGYPYNPAGYERSELR